ncbi:MAG TPA: hypothetical protein DCF86_05115, partial [Dehalococcoidia bacterium]|nr:hypothetical protein [Dehalococcoidia bacterium]
MPPQTQDDSPLDMQQLLDEMEFKSLRRGEIVEGSVMRANSEGIYLDIGHKEEGFIPPNEMRTIPSDELEAINEGDPLIAFVLRTDSQDGPILSVDRARGEEGWRELQKYMEADETIEGNIIGFNRGGCILEVANVQGFVPMSQLVTISHDLLVPQTESEEGQSTADGDSVEAAQPDGGEFVGTSLKVKVLEVNRSRNRAIFSERSALREQREAQKAALIEELSEGEIRKGKVTGISNFGAFVDMGG